MVFLKYIRNVRLLKVVLVNILVGLLASCSDNDYLNAIPDDSQLIMSINSAKVSGVGSPVILKSLLHVSKVDDIGIDISSNVYFFEDAKGNFGVCAKVSDGGKLTDVLEKRKIVVHEKRKFRFAPLPNNWVIGYSDKAALLMGPVMPARQAEFMSQMVRYLSAGEEEGVRNSPMFEKLDSIDAPIGLVCQTRALPQQFSAPFSIGAPKNAEPDDVMFVASLKVNGGKLLMNGETFSFKKNVNDALLSARKVYRPIEGNYVKSMSSEEVFGLFLNVDGKQFHSLVMRNRGISAMLAGINSAIDMDNILRSVDGDLSITSARMSNDGLGIRMAAKLSSASWLDDVGYWKQSVPAGGLIGDWGENCFYYKSEGTSYYFGVTPDMQYMSGCSREEALRSVESCAVPIDADLQKMIVGQKLVMIVNFKALEGTEAGAFMSMLKPMMGNLTSIVYTLNDK